MKKRRYDEGGVTEGPNKNIDDDTRERALAFARRNAERGTELMGIGDPEESGAAKPVNRPPRRPIGRPAEAYPNETRKLQEQRGRAEIKRLESIDKPIERVTPEADLLPAGRVMRGLQGLGSAFARRFGPKELNTIRMPETPRLTGPASRERLEGPPRRPLLGGPKQRNREAARDAEEARFADEGNPNFKRGGKVQKYAKGGSVSSTSSASRRGDGIAQRGKTKGRMY